MEIEVRTVGKYKEVTVKANGTTVELGLFDEEEARILAGTLTIAARDLFKDIETARQATHDILL